jgi:hypothetical protein
MSPSDFANLQIAERFQLRQRGAELAQRVLGLTREAAEAEIEAAGFGARIRRVDGKGLWGTADARIDRINLDIEGGMDGLVVKAYVG